MPTTRAGLSEQRCHWVRAWEASCGHRCPATPATYQSDITLIGGRQELSRGEDRGDPSQIMILKPDQKLAADREIAGHPFVRPDIRARWLLKANVGLATRRAPQHVGGARQWRIQWFTSR